MRTFEEIEVDISQAISINDAEALFRFSKELDDFSSPQAEASACNARGWASFLTGDNPMALEYLRRALVVFDELDKRAGVAGVTSNIGSVYFRTGDYPSALGYYRRALVVYEELGRHAGAANATVNIGLVYAETDDYPAALEHYNRSLAVYEELGNRAGVAHTTCAMGNVYIAVGDYPSALERYRRALAMNEELGSRDGLTSLTGNVITALIKLDRYDEAAEQLGRQAAMHMDSPHVRVQHMCNSATLAKLKEDYDAAYRHLMEALATANEAGMRASSGGCHELLRDLAKQRNDFEGYIEHNDEYQRIMEEIHGKEATQRMAMMEAERRAEAVERERDKERAILYSALPSHVADRLVRGEDVSGDHFDHASVLFLDVVGFTTNTDDLEPRVVTELLNDIFRALDELCEKHNVTKIKTIGDAYLAVAFPQDDQSTEANIAYVALDLQQLRFSWPNASPLQFRIGLHSGPVVAGVIGTTRMQYDVWGDTVNTASRMESTSEPGRIHVSSSFALALKGEMAKERKGETAVIPGASEEQGVHSPFPIPYSLRERGALEIKGKGTMTTYWLERAVE